MKKRNWKVMSLLMAGAMLAGSLTGCGSSPSEEGNSGADNSQQSEQSSEEQSEQSCYRRCGRTQMGNGG